MKAAHEFTKEDIAMYEREIDAMTHLEMASLRRFAPAGHPFSRRDLPLAERFEARFKSLGGFTPAISKAIGW